MTLVYRKGDLIRLTVPTMSGWQGIGVVLEPVHQDDDPCTVVNFRKQGEDEDATPCIALLSEVELVRPTNRQLDRVLTRIWNEPGNGRELLRDFLARWGTSNLAETRSLLEPIPVSERLPGPRDCIANPRNGQGQWCWGWKGPGSVETVAVLFSGGWRMMRREWLANDATHWLPANALPVPSGEVEE